LGVLPRWPDLVRHGHPAESPDDRIARATEPLSWRHLSTPLLLGLGLLAVALALKLNGGTTSDLALAVMKIGAATFVGLRHFKWDTLRIFGFGMLLWEAVLLAGLA